VIVVVLFGASRVTDIFGGVGKGIREFRKELKGDEEEQKPAARAEEPTDAATTENKSKEPAATVDDKYKQH